jgi:hypothetical protein
LFIFTPEFFLLTFVSKMLRPRVGFLGEWLGGDFELRLEWRIPGEIQRFSCSLLTCVGWQPIELARVCGAHVQQPAPSPMNVPTPDWGRQFANASHPSAAALTAAFDVPRDVSPSFEVLLKRLDLVWRGR